MVITVRSGEWIISLLWMARRAALRNSSSLFGTGASVPLPPSVDAAREESKLDEGNTCLALFGSRPMRRGFGGWRDDRGRGPGPVNGPMMEATARPEYKSVSV